MQLSPHNLALLLLVPLALAPIGCDGDDEGDDEAADADTTDDGMDTTDDTTDTGEPDLAAGQMIHDTTCAVASCHAAGEPVQLADRVPMLTDPEIETQIRNGSMSPEGTMPGYGENIIDAQGLANLIAYLRDMYG